MENNTMIEIIRCSELSELSMISAANGFIYHKKNYLTECYVGNCLIWILQVWKIWNAVWEFGTFSRPKLETGV